MCLSQVKPLRLHLWGVSLFPKPGVDGSPGDTGFLGKLFDVSACFIVFSDTLAQTVGYFGEAFQLPFA